MKPTFTLSAAWTAIAAANAAAPTMLRIAPPPLSNLALDAHPLVDDLAALDDQLSVKLDGAIAHRHIVMPARVALPTALRVRAGREEKIARERARRRAMALRRIAMQRDAIPERLRIHSPAEVRHGVRVAIRRA